MQPDSQLACHSTTVQQGPWFQSNTPVVLYLEIPADKTGIRYMQAHEMINKQRTDRDVTWKACPIAAAPKYFGDNPYRSLRVRFGTSQTLGCGSYATSLDLLSIPLLRLRNIRIAKL